MDSARVYVGCENLSMISRQFHIAIGDQLCNIKIEITCKIDTSERITFSPEIEAPTSKADTSASVGEGMATGSGKVGFSDQPSRGLFSSPLVLERATCGDGLMTNKDPLVKRKC